MLVLDTSALFTMDAPPDEDYVCPTGVIRELESFDDPRLALWGDLLRTSDCSKESLAIVDEAARKTGDAGRLSPMDRTVIALALDVDGTILSDDYSIQNVARVLGIEFRAVGTKGIKKVVKWNYQCIGCRKWYKEKSEECPVCGSPCAPAARSESHGKMRLQRMRLPILRAPRIFMHMVVLESDLNANVSASFLLNAAVLRGFSMTARHSRS